MVVDGIDYPTPNNEDIQDVLVYFNIPGFATTVCNDLTGLVTYNTYGTFQFTETPFITLLPCDLSENDDFEDLYLLAFYMNESNFPFLYSIDSQGQGLLLLTVTNNSNNMAVYENMTLSVADTRKETLRIYPNPTKDIFYIENKNGIIINSIKIYDHLGRLVVQDISNYCISANTNN